MIDLHFRRKSIIASRYRMYFRQNTQNLRQVHLAHPAYPNPSANRQAQQACSDSWTHDDWRRVGRSRTGSIELFLKD